MELTNTLKNIIHYAVQVTEPEEVILFGSMANGTADVFSDVDLLIIVENAIGKKEAIARIKNHVTQFSLKTDVLIYSRSEFEREITVTNSFLSAIKKTGKIVYKKCLV